MTPPASTSITVRERLSGLGEWVLVVGVAGTLAWTTLCLGGYLAETMVVTSWLVFGLTALAGLLWILGRGDQPLVLNWAALLPVPFVLYALVSVWQLAPARWLAWREWLLWLQMLLMFGLVLHFGRTRRHTWVLVGTFIGLGLAGTGMAAYQRFTDPTWLMLGRIQADQFFGRSSGMFGIPNSFAGLLELVIPASLVLLFSRGARPVTRIVCAGLAALFLFSVGLTGSRGGWIGLGLALVLWPFLAGREWRRRLAGAGLILALSGVGLWALYRYSENARERIQPFLEGRFEASRPIMWKVAWQIWRDHPWLGRGAASYNVVFDQYRPRGFLNEPDWAHNDYLNTLSDYGVAGFTLWSVAGGALLWLAWRAVRRARRENLASGHFLDLWQWRLGLLLGLLAFAFHLAVDFHTKLPALALAAAVGAALLLRDEPALACPVRTGWARLAGLGAVIGSLLVAALLALPLYRAEALRFESRRSIDRYASTGRGKLAEIIPAAKRNFEQAVQVNPANGQAWADLSYAIVQSWLVSRGDLAEAGRQATTSADRALALCSINAEFWVRKGVALDMQGRRAEGDPCFRRAVELAPNQSAWWYYLGYHLKGSPARKQEALQAVDTCLALDPSSSAGITLRQQLIAGR